MKKAAIFLALSAMAVVMNYLSGNNMSAGPDQNTGEIMQDENGVMSIKADNGVISLERRIICCSL